MNIGASSTQLQNSIPSTYTKFIFWPKLAENGVALRDPAWLDTVNVPHGGTVDVILDFTDPIIKGMSLFHCHLLNHEDKGMMAKILFK